MGDAVEVPFRKLCTPDAALVERVVQAATEQTSTSTVYGWGVRPTIDPSIWIAFILDVDVATGPLHDVTRHVVELMQARTEWSKPDAYRFLRRALHAYYARESTLVCSSVDWMALPTPEWTALLAAGIPVRILSLPLGRPIQLVSRSTTVALDDIEWMPTSLRFLDFGIHYGKPGQMVLRDRQAVLMVGTLAALLRRERVLSELGGSSLPITIVDHTIRCLVRGGWRYPYSSSAADLRARDAAWRLCPSDGYFSVQRAPGVVYRLEGTKRMNWEIGRASRHE